MFLKGKSAVLKDEGFEGRQDIWKIKGMLEKDEKLLMVIPIETTGKGDYDLVAGLTPTRILIADADNKHQVSLGGNIKDIDIRYWETPKKHGRIEIGGTSYKIEEKRLTKEFVNMYMELKSKYA